MDKEAELAEIRRLCVEHLGGHVGRQLADMVKPGFSLIPCEDSTGRNRFGGPAVLNSGTPWPEYDGAPLSLYAVLDTDELAAWLGDGLPSRPGLLNFFYSGNVGDRDDPELCQVIPADPARAVETHAPAGAEVFSPAVPFKAEPVWTLPGRWAPELSGLELEPDSDYPYPAFMFVHDNFMDTWGDYCRQRHSADQAFGHPRLLVDQHPEGSVQLLQVSSNELWQWSEGGWLHFMLPAQAWRDGDFGQAFVHPDGW